MKTLYIESAPQQPSVFFDPQSGRLMITGNSVTCDPSETYENLLTGILNYVKQPQPETNVSILLQHINSKSHQYLFIVLTTLDRIADQSVLKIDWLCDATDDALLEKIEMIEDEMRTAIHRIPYIETKRPQLADYCIPA